MNDFEPAATAWEDACRPAKKTDGELPYRAALSSAKLSKKEAVKRVLETLAGLKIEMEQSRPRLMIQNEVAPEEWNAADNSGQPRFCRFQARQ